ncbi:MAG: DUF1826 domain-containing protein [Aureispira sp.]
MIITSFKNAAVGKGVHTLNAIHLQDINIAIQERTLQNQGDEILEFLNKDIALKLEGDANHILKEFTTHLTEQGLPHGFLLNDLSSLLQRFETISQISSFRIFFSTIATNMCRRFHTDVNNLRLLCTYHGPATLWLPDEIVNRSAYQLGEDNDRWITNPKLIQQANTGDILLLKGLLHPNGKAVFHRSPSIEEQGNKRLLLRIDMN